MYGLPQKVSGLIAQSKPYRFGDDFTMGYMPPSPEANWAFGGQAIIDIHDPLRGMGELRAVEKLRDATPLFLSLEKAVKRGTYPKVPRLPLDQFP